MAKKPAVSLADLTEATPAQAIIEPIENNVTTLKRDDVITSKRAKHTSLYLPSEAQRAIKEIAFQFDKRPHDLYIEGINLMLAKYGKPPVAGRVGKFDEQ